MTRLFTGDFSTGDFSQWSRVITPTYPTGAIGVNHPRASGYTANIVTDDPDSGYAARFELRSGDSWKSEVRGDTFCYAAAGTTVWYAWSTKFDQNFPNNRNELLWGMFTGWKAASTTPYYTEYGSPVIEFAWDDPTSPTYSQTHNGYAYLSWNPQSSPGVGTSFPGGGYYGGKILAIPLEQGQWHDFKMCAYWAQDNTGTLQLWRNGVPQTFLAVNGFAGGTTLTGQTVCGGTGPAGVTFQQGFYRNTAATHTDVIYHRGFRTADSENSL